jgi:hypothetical protein
MLLTRQPALMLALWIGLAWQCARHRHGGEPVCASGLLDGNRQCFPRRPCRHGHLVLVRTRLGPRHLCLHGCVRFGGGCLLRRPPVLTRRVPCSLVSCALSLDHDAGVPMSRGRVLADHAQALAAAFLRASSSNSWAGHQYARHGRAQV